jgi:transposase
VHPTYGHAQEFRFSGRPGRATARPGPLAGDLFVFRSKRGDRLKLLYWDSDGLAIWYKRLEEGTFVFPTPDPQRAPVGAHGLVIRPAELAMLLDGIDLTNVRRRRRYQRPLAPSTP